MTQPTPAQPLDSLRRPLFLWSLPFIYLYFALPIISKAFGASAVEIGGLFSIFTLTTLLLRPLAGWLLDRYGRKPFFIGALGVYALSNAVFAQASSLEWLYAARLIQGIGSAFLWAAVNTIVADLAPAGGRGKAMGQVSETITRGGLAGVLAASLPMVFFPEDVIWTIAFYGFAALTLAAGWLAWKTVPPTRQAAPRRRERPAFSRQFILLLGFVFITAIPEAMLSPIYLVYLQDKFTTDIESIAWAFFPAGLITAAVGARLGAVSDRIGRAPAMAAGLAGAGLLSLLMPGLPSLFWLALLYTVSAVLSGLAEPAEAALVADLTGDDHLGTAYGLYDFVEHLGFVIGPLLGGLVYDTAGRGVPFYLHGTILLAGAAWVLVFLRPAKNGVEYPGQDG